MTLRNIWRRITSRWIAPRYAELLAPSRPRAFFCLLVITSGGAAMQGCSSPPRASRSILEQTVTAMDRREWERADELLSAILPPTPETDADDPGAQRDRDPLGR